MLIADGNYPLLTRSSSTARRVYLNLAPGMVTVSDVLDVLVDSVPIEAADVMTTDTGEEPAIVADFRALLPGTCHLCPTPAPTSTRDGARPGRRARRLDGRPADCTRTSC